MNIIYLHGLSSSGNSNTAHRIKELFPEDNVIAPDLPVNPFDALKLIDNILKPLPVNDTVVLGTSMGGMFAQQQAPYRRILVNPAFHVSTLLRDNIGKKLPFFSQRQDGATEFEVTEELCRQYEEMESKQFDKNNNAKNVIGLFGKYDETVNCKQEYLDHYSLYHDFEGGHRMNNDVIENVLVPVLTFLHKPGYAFDGSVDANGVRLQYNNHG